MSLACSRLSAVVFLVIAHMVYGTCWAQVTLSLHEPQITGQEVTLNGVATGEPKDIVFNWGDGTKQELWFPAKHSYQKPGVYTIVVNAYSQSGQAAVAIVEVQIGAIERESQPEQDNRPPKVTEIVFDPSREERGVQVGSTVRLTIVASDPDNDPLDYTWYIRGTSFKPKKEWKAKGKTFEWRVPDDMSYYILIATVRDNKKAVDSLEIRFTSTKPKEGLGYRVTPLQYADLPPEVRSELIEDKTVYGAALLEIDEWARGITGIPELSKKAWNLCSSIVSAGDIIAKAKQGEAAQGVAKFLVQQGVAEHCGDQGAAVFGAGIEGVKAVAGKSSPAALTFAAGTVIVNAWADYVDGCIRGGWRYHEYPGKGKLRIIYLKINGWVNKNGKTVFASGERFYYYDSARKSYRLYKDGVVYVAQASNKAPVKVPANAQIAGSLVDMDTGRPLAGAVVQLRDSQNTLVQTFNVGQGGVYLFSGVNKGRYWVNVTKDGYFQNYYPWNKNEFIVIEDKSVHNSPTLKLGRTCHITVRILDKATGRPLPQATVRLFNQANNEVHSTTTDANGCARFNVARGEYYLRAEKEGFTRQFDPVDKNKYIKVPGDASQNLLIERPDLALPRNMTPPPQPSGAVVQGTVYDLDTKKALVAVPVKLHEKTRGVVATAATDQTGRYTFMNVAQGAYWVTIEKGGYLRNWYPWDSSQYFAVPTKGICSIPPLGIGRSYSIRLRIIDAQTEAPLRGATAMLYDKQGKAVMTVESDRKGVVLLTGVVEGDYYIKAAKQGYKTGFVPELKQEFIQVPKEASQNLLVQKGDLGLTK